MKKLKKSSRNFPKANEVKSRFLKRKSTQGEQLQECLVDHQIVFHEKSITTTRGGGMIVRRDSC
jgi:hypothetical protein